MQGLLRIARAIDRMSDGVGVGVSWLATAMVLIGAYNALARYFSRAVGVSLAPNTLIELQWYLFALMFLLAAAHTLSRDAHVRVDVFYGRLSARAQAWINLLGSVLFLLPFCGFAFIMSWSEVANSWAVLEGSPDPGGLPRYPIKTAILVAFVLVAVQGVSQAIKALAGVRGLAIDPPREARPEAGTKGGP